MWKPILAIAVGSVLGGLLRWGLGLKLNSLLPNLPPGTLEVLEGHGFGSVMHEENIELPAWSGFFARFA